MVRFIPERNERDEEITVSLRKESDGCGVIVGDENILLLTILNSGKVRLRKFVTDDAAALGLQCDKNGKIIIEELGNFRT